MGARFIAYAIYLHCLFSDVYAFNKRFMNLLATITILFSDDPYITMRMKEEAMEAKIEDLNTSHFLNQECVVALKRLQLRKSKLYWKVRPKWGK